MGLQRVGIWSRQLRFGDRAEAVEAAAELEELGYGALWIPGGGGGDDLLDSVTAALEATSSIPVATGILNVWGHDAGAVADAQARLDAGHPGRFLLGLGVGHPSFVDGYRRPLDVMTGFLDVLDAHRGRRPRVLAALAPRMLALARARADGAHPYLVPVAHTAIAREALGPEAVLAPELSVVLAPSLDEAEAIARADLELYLGLPNYVGTWRRLGYAGEDFENGGSARLVRALYALGPVEEIERRTAEHLAAGADHVCLRVITSRADDATHLPREEWRELAPVAAALR